MKLYRVTLVAAHGTYYVVAKNPGIAYMLVRKPLDDNGEYFVKDRVMRKIELLAEMGEYRECETRLFLQSN